MIEYVCLTILAPVQESESAFKARLTAFWTHLIRNHPDDYKRVYAEAARFGWAANQLSRQYMVEADAIAAVIAELFASGIAFTPVDLDDLYTKYEAVSPDWFQIPH